MRLRAVDGSTSALAYFMSSAEGTLVLDKFVAKAS